MKKLWILCAAALVLSPAAQAQMKGTSVQLTSQDGWTISALYQPAESGQKTVLLLHDAGKDKQAFSAFAQRLTDKGIGCLAPDLRGHGQSVNKGGYAAFAKEGVDNDYNKMTRDVNAAVEFLKNKGIAEEDLVFVGAGMGANVAAKSASLWPEVGGLALLTPSANFRDVLSIPALRVYKGNVFIATAADDKKAFLEASILRNVAFLSAGEGKVVFATAYNKKSHEMLDVWIAPELVQWLVTPQKPKIRPDLPPAEEETDFGSYEPVMPSDTEEALVPSVLE